jgi:hypothetical protein
MNNLFDKKHVFALVGASNTRSKYGNIVFRNLTESEYKVIPINSHEEMIEGIKAYKSIELVPEKIDLVIFVIPPEKVLDELLKIKDLGIMNVWFQLGSESEEAINFCEENKISCTHHACIMVQKPTDD